MATIGGVWITLGANSSAFVAGLGKAQAALGSFGGKVAAGVGKVGSVVGSGLSSAASAVGNTLGSLFSSLPGAAGSALSLFSTLGGGVQSLFQGIGSLFQSIPFVGSAISGLIGSIGILGGGFLVAGGALAAFGVHQAMLKEDTLVTMKVLAGSAETAKGLYDDLESLAIRFRMPVQDTTFAASKLLQAGIAAKNVPSMMEQLMPLSTLGGGSAADNMSMLIKAVTDVQNAGQLRGQEVLQLTNAGVNIRKLIADKLGKSVGEVVKMQESGEISSAMALNALLERGNSLTALLDEKAQTLSGIWGGVTSTFKLVMRDIGEGLIKELNLKGSLTSFNDWLAKLRTEWAPTVVRVMGNVIKAVEPIWKAGDGV